MYADLALRLPSTTARWQSPEFRAELEAWVAGGLGELTSFEPLRHRSWSTVWRAETATGEVHFAKTNTPLQNFEAAAVVELVRVAPDHVVPVTVADVDRGFLLTPDQGPPLRETAAGLDEAGMVDLAARVMAAGAELQREVAPYADRLAAAGLVQLAAADAAAYVEQRLLDFAAVAPEDPRAMSVADRQRTTAELAALRTNAATVAALGLPLTLDHNDLHDNNVFEVDGRLLFFDFGDAVLAEPLGVLRVPLANLAQRLDTNLDDPRVLAAADPALEVWSDIAPMPDLRAALPAAIDLARLPRAESWIRCLASMDDAELAEWGDAAAYWLTPP